VNIKAQGLLNAAKWIEETYGQDALREVIRACSEPVRERYISAIAIEWHPVEELVELLQVADTQLGKGDGKVAEEIGAAGAKMNLRGAMLRLVFYLAKPEFLMKRVAQLWRQFNDEGEMLLTHFGDYSSGLEVKGLTKPQWLFCCTLTGWAREVTRASGGTNPQAKHVECRARGGHRCLWELTWSGVTASQAAENARKALSSNPPPMPEGTPASSRRDSIEIPKSARRQTARPPRPDAPPSSRKPRS